MDTRIGLPATLAGFEDRARFLIAIDEQPMGTTDVEWRSDGGLTSRSRISYAGQTLETSLEIAPGDDGRWREIVVRMAPGTLTVSRECTSVTRRFGDRSSTLETPELEPNARFSPDAKWVLFRSNMLGPTYVFAVEVGK
jgi:hypothetical protein